MRDPFALGILATCIIGAVLSTGASALWCLRIVATLGIGWFAVWVIIDSLRSQGAVFHVREEV